MDIESIMSRTVITGLPDSGLTELCSLMNENYIGSVVIVNGTKPVGIVTERDVVRAVAEYGNVDHLKAEDIMDSPVLTRPPAADIHETMEFMKNNRIRRLPITIEGDLTGIVTYGDILRYMKKALSDSHVVVRNLRTEVDRDKLTGVYSRAYFDRVFAKEVSRVKKYGGSLSLLMIDVDNFKEINDRYGHAGGDNVLTQIASILQLNVREINSVCRFGGDEFSVIAPISDIHGASRMAERLRQVVEAAILFQGEDELKLTLSIGVASWQGSMNTANGLLIAADTALYASKKNGRNRVSTV